MAGASTGRSWVRNPLTWSFVALVVSVLSLVIAFSAFARAGSGDEAEPQVAVSAAPVRVTTEAASTADAAPTDTPTPSSEGPTSTALPTAGATYSVYKQDVKVRLAGGSSRYLDLDQPLVNASSNVFDVSYQPGYTQPHLNFTSASVAVGKSPAVTPDECAQEIQLSPVDRNVDVSQDLVLCAVTNGLGAVDEPARTKMARIIVNSVSKDDSLNLTITTWEIPR